MDKEKINFEKRKNIAFIVIAIVLLIIVIFLINSSPKKLLIYNAKSYEEYVSSRNVLQKVNDANFVNNQIKEHGTSINASNIKVKEGIEYLIKNDEEKAVEKFVQAGILSKDNFNIYWAFATLFVKRKELNISLDMLSTALAKYNQTYEMKQYDKIKLLCDYGFISVTKAFQAEDKERTELINKTYFLIDEAVSTEKNNGAIVVSGKVAAPCFYTKGMALYLEGKYRESKEEVEKAKLFDSTITNLSPAFYELLSRKLKTLNSNVSIENSDNYS